MAGGPLRRRGVVVAIAGDYGRGAHRLLFFPRACSCGAQLAWQVATLDIADQGNCLARFKSNRLIGWALFLGLAADMALATLLTPIEVRGLQHKQKERTRDDTLHRIAARSRPSSVNS